MEQRHDWAKFVFTLELFKYVFFNLIPDVLFHERKQDEEQVRGTYDRTFPPPSRALHRIDASQVVTTFTGGSSVPA